LPADLRKVVVRPGALADKRPHSVPPVQANFMHKDPYNLQAMRGNQRNITTELRHLHCATNKKPFQQEASNGNH
jgi:hypothetical protein